MTKKSWLFRLEYKLKTDEDYIVDDPKPVHWNPGPFELTLKDEVVIVEMNVPCKTIEEARQKVEPFLFSWEVDAMLNIGRTFKFKFVKAQPSVRETSPWNPSDSIKVSQLLTEVAYKITKSEYRQPPKSFCVDQDVEVMWLRYKDYLQHHLSLASMGYFCLTVLEGRGGGREQAGRVYKVKKKVLSNLGKLTTTVGNRHNARKFGEGKYRPFSKPEKRWVKEAIKKLIRRAGEVAHSGSEGLPYITMDDLPEI